MRFADTAAARKADDYFDLMSAQKDEVKTQLKIFLKAAYENNNREIPCLFTRTDAVLSKVSDTQKVDCDELGKIRTAGGNLIFTVSNVAVDQVRVLPPR